MWSPLRPRARGFRDAPRNTFAQAVVPLHAHNRPEALLHDGVGMVPHPQCGHQVFEHRSGPGEQDSFAARECMRAAKMEPRFLRNIALRDGHEYGCSSLRCEQVVVRGLQASRRNLASDGQHFFPRMIKKPEIHLTHEGIRNRGDFVQFRRHFRGEPAFGTWLARQPQCRLLHRPERRREITAVHSGDKKRLQRLQ